MLITKVSPMDNSVNTLDLDITEQQYASWQSGELIQNAMPNLTPDEREFLISGLLPNQWDDLFPEEER